MLAYLSASGFAHDLIYRSRCSAFRFGRVRLRDLRFLEGVELFIRQRLSGQCPQVFVRL